jgi:putative phosphoesterase
MRVGVISDTHGLLRPEALAALSGVDHILHAGDVGEDGILNALAEVAPLTAIRGNVDRSGRSAALPATEMVELGGFAFYMLHDLHQLELDPIAAGIDVVVSGHSHQPLVERHKGILYLNPGSAGPRRFSLPVSVGFVRLGSGAAEAEILRLV